MRGRLLRAALLVLRLAVAAVLVYAGWVKLRQPPLLFALEVDSYQLLPSWAVLALAYALPWVELGLGLWLASGLAAAWSATAATLLLGTFFGVVLRTYLKGLEINCGCFGPSEPLTRWTVVRDGLLVVMALVTAAGAWWQRRRRAA
jgi:uncharacterized membrane protein YphA (DoxX/SURF4 family)